MSKLARNLISLVGDVTLTKTAEVGLQNAAKNLPHITRSITDLVPREGGRQSKEAAIVVAGGPSLQRTDSIGRIQRSGFEGNIVVVERALGPCLRAGLIPTHVVTVDPARRHARWFGDPDPPLDNERMEENRKLVELVNKLGKHVKAVIATSVDPAVTMRCMEAGMELYWWNPLYDDFTRRNSYTRRVHELTGVPCMVGGGNAGTAAWVFAHSVLKAQHIGLVGIDFGYAPDTPMEETQYYPVLVDLAGKDVENTYIRIYNPYLKETWFTDPVFYWYLENFLKMAQLADCTTWNCTEGGILFGKGIKFVPLEAFVEKVASPTLGVSPGTG